MDQLHMDGVGLIEEAENPCNMSWADAETYSLETVPETEFSPICRKSSNGVVRRLATDGGYSTGESSQASTWGTDDEDFLPMEREIEFLENEDFQKLITGKIIKSPIRNKRECDPHNYQAKRVKSFHQKEYEENIKGALDKLDAEPDLIGDFSKTHSLPIISGKHQDLKSITPTTLENLFKGKYSSKIESFLLIDSRFPYEFEGGHIRGARNFYMKEQIDELLTKSLDNNGCSSEENKENFSGNKENFSGNKENFSGNKENFPENKENFSENKENIAENKKSFSENFAKNKEHFISVNKEFFSANKQLFSVNKENFSGNFPGNKEYASGNGGTSNKILIFHCEFSSERGPNMARYLRKLDRERNAVAYPKLTFPEIYLLDGGYRDYYNLYPKSCVPEKYTPMLHPDYSDELKHFRAKSKSENNPRNKKNHRKGRLMRMQSSQF